MSSSKQQTAHTGVDPQFSPSYFIGLLRRLLPTIQKDDLTIKQLVGLTGKYKQTLLTFSVTNLEEYFLVQIAGIMGIHTRVHKQTRSAS